MPAVEGDWIPAPPPTDRGDDTVALRSLTTATLVHIHRALGPVTFGYLTYEIVDRELQARGVNLLDHRYDS